MKYHGQWIFSVTVVVYLHKPTWTLGCPGGEDDFAGFMGEKARDFGVYYLLGICLICM